MNWFPVFGGGNNDGSYTVRLARDGDQYYLIQSHLWFSIHEGHEQANFTVRKLWGAEWQTIYESPVDDPIVTRKLIGQIQEHWETWLMEQLL